MIVAEKPSVAKAYAKVLGATNRQDGYLEGNGYLVSWCVGHLVELAPPNIYDAKYVKWSIADLPILPQKWQYLVSASTKKQFGILQKLMHRPDVDSVICATDAGREGELIFRLVYQQAGCKKPFSRLWLSSMECCMNDLFIQTSFCLKAPYTFAVPGRMQKLSQPLSLRPALGLKVIKSTWSPLLHSWRPKPASETHCEEP